MPAREVASVCKSVPLLRVLIMDDRSDDTRRGSHRPIEVYAGAGRQRWPDTLKAQIVAESFVRGAVVVEIARRHRCRPQQVHAWRKLARAGKLVLPACEAGLTFVPLVAETGAPTRTPAPAASEIMVELGDCIVKVHGRPGAAALADVFTALREARSC